MNERTFIRNVKALSTKIKKSNNRFKKMTPSQKRVAIAKDVLALLKAGKLVPTRRLYVDTPFDNVRGNKLPASTELQAVFKAMPECNACALGSMFICAVSKFNKLTIGEAVFGGELEDGDEPYHISDGYTGRPDTYLRQYFDDQQLDKIERYFEHSIEDSPEVSLEKIMKNIIKNNGRFTLEW